MKDSSSNGSWKITKLGENEYLCKYKKDFKLLQEKNEFYMFQKLF